MDRHQRLALLSRDDEAAAPYAARVPEDQIAESWQLIEPTGVRMMHGPAGIRVLECLPATALLGRALRLLRLTALVTLINHLLDRIRKPMGRFFPNPEVPRRWP